MNAVARAASTPLSRYFGGHDLLAVLFAGYTVAVASRNGLPVSLAPVHAGQALLASSGFILMLGMPYIGAFVLLEDRRLARERGAGLSLAGTLRSLLSRYDRRHAWEIVRTLTVVYLVLVLHYNLHPRVPHINPALYDGAFRAIDTWLFFGTDPVRAMTQSSLFTNDAFCELIDRSYVAWYLVKFVVVPYFLFQPDLLELRRFATAYVFMWATHIVLVLLWPSLGPAFVTPEWFHGLNLPIAQSLQDFLLRGYEADLQDPARIAQFGGISGFPSLHVGLVGLYAMFLWRHSRTAAVGMWLYTLVIEVGSGLTGWHYLCDGLAGVLMAAIAFGMARWMYPLSRSGAAR